MRYTRLHSDDTNSFPNVKNNLVFCIAYVMHINEIIKITRHFFIRSAGWGWANSITGQFSWIFPSNELPHPKILSPEKNLLYIGWRFICSGISCKPNSRKKDENSLAYQHWSLQHQITKALTGDKHWQALSKAGEMYTSHFVEVVTVPHKLDHFIDICMICSMTDHRWPGVTRCCIFSKMCVCHLFRNTQKRGVQF